MSFQIYISKDTHYRVRTKVSVADSEEDFNNTTVKKLKRLIPYGYNHTKLLYKGVKLKDGRTLGFYGIKHEDEIIAGHYDVFESLDSCSGRNQCRLIFGSRYLEDDQTLGSYNIRDGSTLQETLRLRGGERTGPDPSAHEDKGVSRTESMEKLSEMQQDESWCSIL